MFRLLSCSLVCSVAAFVVKDGSSLRGMQAGSSNMDAVGNATLLSAEEGTGEGLECHYFYDQSDCHIKDLGKLTPANRVVVPKIWMVHGKFPEVKQGNHFCIRCTGQLIIKKEGQYNFFLSSDDGSKMWLNDKQVVDNDGCHGERERGSSKTKYTAGAHKLVVDMCEYGGGEVLKMQYKGPDTGNSKKAVPKSALRLPMQKCKGTLLDKPKDDVACDKIKDKSKCKDGYERVAQTDTYLQCVPTDASQEVNGLINCLAQDPCHL
mmetsp:Transcript_75246/g.176575  ORF Transcript_75246/g.176575 Transcript_75246/m.176575 type:complete len:264 (+) Transcript_75246:66-857(+)|eukprot:s1596_g17.t1